LLAGCRPERHCAVTFIGDPSQPPEIQMLITDGASQTFAMVMSGQAAPVEPPPQGGYVMYVGAAARNLDACGVELRGELRDPATNDQIAFDARTTNLILGTDGWGRPDPSNNSNVSNVNACPDYTPKDVQGKTYLLGMTVVDRENRKASLSIPVVPTCMLANPAVQADCVCTCSANYFLGKCGASDGG
jgi:hypothetical protein